MTRNEQRVWLIERLLAENPDYRDIEIPADEQEQKNLLRALMNVRMPEPISGEFLKVQDEYLTAERELAGVVAAAALPAVVTNDKIALWRGDITTLKVDAIVNAANSALLGCFQPLHSCIDNIIHTKSGIELRLYCNELMEEGRGEAGQSGAGENDSERAALRARQGQGENSAAPGRDTA